MDKYIPLKPIALLLTFLFWEQTYHAQTFREISGQVGIDAYCVDEHIMAGGVAFFDYNQDYYPDIFILGGEKDNALYRNNWDGSFSNVSKSAGVELKGRNTYGVAIGDIDNDGDEDMFITTGIHESNILLENNGDGTFEDISLKAGITEKVWSTSASFGDFNQDGWVDIYVSNYAEFTNLPFAANIDRCSPNFLYQNKGDNQFVEVASKMGVADIGCGLAVTFTDCDNDHDVDLHIANDFGGTFEPNELYFNTYPNEGFQQAPSSAKIQVKINGMGIATGDYDEDGDLDYYVTNMGENPFFENINSSHFLEVGFQRGVANPDGTSWGTAFFDFDHDTYLDLVVANGQVVEANHQNNENRLFRGSASHKFHDISQKAGVAHTDRCRGFSMADFDNDGDLDMMFGVVAAAENSESNTLVYQNNLVEPHNWLKIRLQGTVSHRNAYGSHIRAVIGDRSLMREADGGSSYLSHSSHEIHFGLGTTPTIDSLIVDWPGGHQDVFLHIPSNQQILVVENSHWLTYEHQEITLLEGDSIYLADAFQKEDGIYHEFIKGSNGFDSLFVITKLQIENPVKDNQSEVDFSISPNPFYTRTQLRYTLPTDSQVELAVYDMKGRRINTLLKTQQSAGKYFFSFKSTSIANTTGLYLVCLRVNGKVYVLKAMNTM